MMKRNHICARLGAWGLSLLMLAGAAVSCAAFPTGSNSDATGSGGEVSSVESNMETEYVPDIEKKNYDCDFNVIYINNGFEDGTHFPTEEQRDVLSGASYDRVLRVKDHLGVTCRTVDGGDWIEYASTIHRGVMSGDDDYQLAMTHVYEGVASLITNNSVLDLASLPSVHLDAPYWNRTVMDSLSLNGKHYLGYSDFSLANTHIIIFNKKLADDHRIGDPYTMVRDRTWTVDRFFEMASTVALDDGNGQWGTEDTYGMTGWGWVNLISFVTSSGMPIVDTGADNKLYLAYSDNFEKLSSLVDKIRAMYNAESTWFWPPSYTEADVIDFSDGTSLFRLYSSADLFQIRGIDIDFGILPYPLYDEAQKEYRSLNWNGQMVVPASVQNTEMVGDVLEMLNYYSAPVTEAYYERMLGTQLAQAPDDSEMLDIIWDAQISDAGLTFANIEGMMDLVYLMPNLCTQNKELSSFLQTNARRVEAGLKKFYRDIEMND